MRLNWKKYEYKKPKRIPCGLLFLRYFSYHNHIAGRLNF